MEKVYLVDWDYAGIEVYSSKDKAYEAIIKKWVEYNRNQNQNKTIEDTPNVDNNKNGEKIIEDLRTTIRYYLEDMETLFTQGYIEDYVYLEEKEVK